MGFACPTDAFSYGGMTVTKTIFAEADTYCRNDDPAINKNGAYKWMYVGLNSSDNKLSRSFIRFKFDAIPQGSYVNSAELNVYSTSNSSGHSIYHGPTPHGRGLGEGKLYLE